jgi:hypothetical protein
MQVKSTADPEASIKKGCLCKISKSFCFILSHKSGVLLTLFCKFMVKRGGCPP